MPRLIWVFVGRTVILLVFGMRRLIFCLKQFEPRHEKTCLWESATRYESNQPAQLQRLARVWTFFYIASIDILLSRKRTTKTLIRLGGCADWSAALLFTYKSGFLMMWLICYFSLKTIGDAINITMSPMFILYIKVSYRCVQIFIIRVAKAVGRSFYFDKHQKGHCRLW